MLHSSSGRVDLGRRSVSRVRPCAPSKVAALLEIWDVVWIVGICGPANFNMAFDGGAGGSIERKHLAVARACIEPDAEEPWFARRREVLALLPSSGLVGVASFGPAPELPKDVIVQPVEGPLGGSMPVIVGPAPDEGVEFVQERFLGEAQSGVDAEAEFLTQGFDVTLCGKAQEFVPKFAHSVPQKVEPLGDGSDDGLLL